MKYRIVKCPLCNKEPFSCMIVDNIYISIIIKCTKCRNMEVRRNGTISNKDRII